MNPDAMTAGPGWPVGSCKRSWSRKATTVLSGCISAKAAGDSWIPPGRSITPP